MGFKTSINILLGLIIAVILFHVAVIAKAIPYDIAWGGRLQSDLDMYVFESVSILINLFLGFMVLMKSGYIKIRLNEKTINVILWVFLVIFALNTVGNLFAKTNFEKSFAVVTFVFALLIWVILRSKQNSRSYLNSKS